MPCLKLVRKKISQVRQNVEAFVITEAASGTSASTPSQVSAKSTRTDNHEPPVGRAKASAIDPAEFAPVAGPLPIDHYDALPSSTVVELLERLNADDLRAIQAHELANRKRRTVLFRAQERLSLLATSNGSTRR